MALHALVEDGPGVYAFRSYGPEQGLRNQAVTCLAQDQAGYLYAGTEDGLYRYDGNRFERFGTDNGLPSDSVALLYQEPGGGPLWVGTLKGLVPWLGRKADPVVKEPLLPGEALNQICASRSGHLVVASARGVFEGTAKNLAPVAGIPMGRSSAAWIAPDDSETLVVTHGRLYRRKAGSTTWEARTVTATFKDEAVQMLLKDGQGRIWMRSHGKLLRLASFEGTAEDLGPKLPGATVQKDFLCLDDAGRIWVPTNLGLACIEDHGVSVISDRQGLPTQWVTAVLMDREGNLWIASEGVHRILGRLAWTAQTRKQQLPSDTVWGVFRSRDGVLWTGTNRGLAKSTAQGWASVPGTQNRSFYSFTETPDGALWIGGNNSKNGYNALLYRSPGGTSFRPVPLTSAQGLSTANSLAFGSDGALYVATQEHGMHRLRRQGSSFRSEAVALPGGDAKEQINQLFRDAKGRLWAAGMSGLACFDGTHWQRFGAANGLREVQVEALAQAPDGDIWVSYWNVHALTRFRLDAKGARAVEHVDGPHSLVMDNIYTLGVDAAGALWLGTAGGVKRWQNGRVDLFGRGEGLPGEDAAANAFWADRNGDVWFGMANGLAHFQASRDRARPPLPTAQILLVQDASGHGLDAPAPKVAWRDRALTFRFSVLSFTNEARVRCQVRLVGFEDAWRDTDIREARYTGLPPGRYRFEVRASLGEDDFGTPSTRVVVILAPWWRTGWARTLAFVAFAGLMALLYRWRLGWLHRRNVHLETLVQARTQQLERANLALQEASMVDPLTGLKNRRFLGLSMPEELARVTRQRNRPDRTRDKVNQDLLFFMVDLDHFKAVNDTYGHAAGDAVLRQASEALRQACREADMVVRWGGEEFLIVARNTDRSAAEVVAKNLWKAVRELRFEVADGVVLTKTCSVGFAAFPVIEGAPNLFSWEEAVELADQCLYAAKKSGRDAWVGVMVPDEAQGEGRKLLQRVPALATEGHVKILTSFPEGTALSWHEG